MRKRPVENYKKTVPFPNAAPIVAKSLLESSSHPIVILLLYTAHSSRLSVFTRRPPPELELRLRASEQRRRSNRPTKRGTRNLPCCQNKCPHSSSRKLAGRVEREEGWSRSNYTSISRGEWERGKAEAMTCFSDNRENKYRCYYGRCFIDP